MTEIIERRLREQVIVFDADLSSSESFGHILHAALQQYLALK